MQVLIYFSIILVLVTSCGEGTNETYKIISEKENVNKEFGINKCNLDIELSKKISIEDLTKIANQLRETRSGYDRLWIFYHLSGMSPSSNPWASSHFTPDLKVEILGSTNSEDKKMDEVKIEGNIIGKWQDTRPYMESIMIIYEKNKKLFMKYIYKDGSSTDFDFLKKKFQGKVRYELKENSHKEYYLIEPNGNLGMYGKNGKFNEARKQN